MRVIIAAGGTGGHLYPGVALAREFARMEPGSEAIFVGTVRGLETKVVPREGFELITITAQGVMGRGVWGPCRGSARWRSAWSGGWRSAAGGGRAWGSGLADTPARLRCVR